MGVCTCSEGYRTMTKLPVSSEGERVVGLRLEHGVIRGIQGTGYRVQGTGYRVLGYRVQGFRIQGLGY